MLYRWMAILTAAAGYATVHMGIGEGAEGWLERTYALDLPLPFAHRVLPTLLARAVVGVTGALPVDAFWLVEVAAVAGLLCATFATLRADVGDRAATLATGALLPVVWMLYLYPGPHRWWACYDAPALAFTAGGLFLARRERYAALALLCLPAAMNRETAILLPLAAVALRPGAWRRVLPAFVAVVAVRLGLAAVLPVAGAAVDLTRDDSDEAMRWLINLRMLTFAPGGAVLLAAMSCLPLAWAAVWRDIPADLRRLGWVSLAVGAGMLVVGNVDEPRVFGEALVLAWVPLVVGVRGWLAGDHRHPRMIRTA